MNERFRALSDLVADAEDLVARVSESGAPEVRALAQTVEDSVSSMKGHLREQARELRAPRNRDLGLGSRSLQSTWVGVAAGAAIGIGVLVWMRARQQARPSRE